MPQTSGGAQEGLITPISHATTAHEERPRGLAPAAILGALVAVALIAAASWFLLRDRDRVPVIQPGQPATTTVAAPTTPAAPVTPAPAQTTTSATAAPAPPVANIRAESPRLKTRVAAAARTRPAARSSGDTAAPRAPDAGATLPDAPQPYSSLNPAATPAPVNPAAPAPAAAVPSTPPTLPEQSPTATPEPQPQPASPPQ